MWSISMLKENAKRMLSGYYWAALGASLIVMLLTGGLVSQYKTDQKDVTELMNSYISGSSAASDSDFNFDSEEDIENYINEFSGAGSASGDEMAEEFEKIFEEAFGDISASDVESVLSVIVGTVAVIVLVSILFSLLYSLLFANPLTVGHNRFYLDARMGNAQVSNIFSQFSNGKFGNTVKTMFLYDLKLWLWGLLGVIPFIFFGFSLVNTIKRAGNMNSASVDDAMALAWEILGSFILAMLAYVVFMLPQIIKRLSYTLVPYLLAENPQMPQKRAFEISVQTMNGEKAHYFGLQMSFIGWLFLASFAGSTIGQFVGVSFGSIVTIAGLVFLYPYIYATYAEFYCCMREKAMATGIASSDELCGMFGKAAQGVPFPEQDAANSMPYQRVDNGAGTSGSYPAYPQNGSQNNSQPTVPPYGGMEEINTAPAQEQSGSDSRISLEKKDSSDDDYTGPEIK
ncbi:MAG: DUF975 family protein [Huintestinicola sp.]|uniref:DUF975 family protein n=1 Tax=Huintestinicola sp. TaxID=2981661 RepID=UPI003F09D3FF